MLSTVTNSTPQSIPTRRSKSSSLLDQTRSLAIILHEEFGETFTFYDGATGEAIVDTGSEGNLDLASCHNPEQIKQVADDGQALATLLLDSQYQLMIPLRLNDALSLVGVGRLSGFARSEAEVTRELTRLQKWVQAVCDRLMMTTSIPSAPKRNRTSGK